MASEPDATAGTQAGQDPTDGDPWQSSGAAANSGWWNSWDGAGNGWWQRGQSWGPYPGHSFSSYGYGGWQQRPGWSDYQWQDKQWGEDSAARQKTGQQQSSSKDGEVPAEAAEEATTARRQSVSTMEDDQWLGEGTGSLDEGSSGKTPSAKATGKDFIPEFDGTTPMREYQRRVKLFEISTSIDASYRAQKLMEKLTGSAWLATESIPLESLKHPDGVSRLLDHLWKELEPLEFLRTFQTLADFYKGFRRQKTQEFVAYDMEFRRHGQRLEEINAGLSGVTKAYWFLEKAGLSSELRKQVVAAAGGQYDYAKLRAAVMAIVPQVEKDPESTSHSNHSGRHWRKGPAKVHATVQDEETEELHEVPDDGGEEMQAEALEEELQCLLTQAAKKRAQVERARGFSSGGGGKGRNETPEARAKRIAELKKKMPCSACKAHGRTVYGHWHSDPECPFGKKVPKPGGDSVLAVMEGDATDSDDYGPLPTDIFMTQIVPEEGEYWCASAVSCPDACANEGLLALSDTCCARSVMGQKWAQTHMKHLHQAGLDAYIVDEARPFRFGAGPRISSEYSVVFPMILKGACGIPWIRVSVVDQDVPLLLSKGAMKAIGTCLDLGAAKVKFTALQTDVPLIETDAGLCGFVINDIAEQQVSATGFPPLNMLEGEAEVEVVQHARGVHVTQKGSDDTCEVLARKFLKDENFSYDALQQVVDNLPEFSGRGQRAINGKPRQCQGLMAGAYAHGAFHGIAKSAQRFPQVIRFLNTFMRNALKASGQQARWTSLVVMKNIRMTLHKDNHNAAESETATVSFGTFQQGQLWVEKQSDSDNGEEVVFKKDKNGKRIPGYNVDTWQRPYLLSPKVQHATQRWTGTRWCLSCYTSRAAPQLDDADKVKLRSLGFPVKQVPDTRTSGNVAHVCNSSPYNQEPQHEQGEESSPIKSTPHDLKGSPTAQPESSNRLREDRSHVQHQDGRQVHCSEEEGRVCGGHPGKDGFGCQRAQEARHGAAEADLVARQAQEGSVSIANGVEEARRGFVEADLRGARSSRPGSPERSALDSMEPANLGDRDRAVAGRSEGDCRTRGYVQRDATVQSVSHTNVRPNESGHQDRLPGVRSLPSMQRNPSSHVQRQADQVRDRRAPKEREEHQGEGGNACLDHDDAQDEPASTFVARVKRGVARWFMDPNGAAARGGQSRGRGPQEDLQHEHHARGARDGDGAPEGQGKRGRLSEPSETGATAGESSLSKSTESHDDEICNETCNAERVPRSPSEVRQRISDGNLRRKKLKQGTLKRLLGNAKALAASVMIASTAAIGMAMQSVPRSSVIRPDVLEVFDEEARMTRCFSRWGWSAADPVDLRLGDDVYDADGRRDLLEWIDRCQPRLVILSCPQKFWSSFNRCPQETSQQIRRRRKTQQQYMWFLEFMEHVFERQIRRGDDVLAENPVASASFRKGPIQNILNHPEVYSVVSRTCEKDVERHKDRTFRANAALWMSSSAEICQELALRCSPSGCLSEAGVKTGNSRSIAAAVCRGYVKALRRKDPSRIRRLLRHIAARIRSNGKSELVKDLRWNEKNISKALSRWSSVFAVGSSAREDPTTDQPMSEPLEDTDGDEELIEDSPMDEDGAGLRTGLAHDGISFDIPPGRRLSAEVREGLKKAHCNLGHPSCQDLQRFLKLGGAKQEVVEAVSWMRCVACAHSSKPKAHRTTSIPPCAITFGDEVHLDCFCIHDSTPDAHWYLSIIDRATSYHIIELLRDHSPSELNKAFDRAWARWAGPPLRVTVDFEGGFRGREFWSGVSEAGTSLVSIAGTAHWQAGKVERHNLTIKDMLRTVIRQTSAKGREELKLIGRETCWAKNSLVREHGWSPMALVFGKEPRVYGELHSQGEPSSFHPRVGDPESELARRMRYRYHAKLEYIKAQARQMLARTAHNRVRKISSPKVGQLVFFWRAERKREPSRWIGPAYVVGLQGHNAWVAIGGRCFLVAGEHLREAWGDERKYGDPQIQKSIALFRKVPKDATFEDLTGQQDPTEEPMEVERQPFAQEVVRDIGDFEEGLTQIPNHLAKLITRPGWQVDEFGNHVLVTYQAWAYRTPESKYDPQRMPYRTTWARLDGEWICLEKEVKWMELDDPHDYLPNAPMEILVTCFQGRTRKEMCLDDMLPQLKRRKGDQQVNQVCAVQHGGVVGKNKLKKMMEKEIPYDKIEPGERQLYREAEGKEWSSWQQYDSCEILSEEESQRVMRENPKRVLPSRFVYRNKNAGLLDENGRALPTRAKARLCLQGHLCPDSRTGAIQVDSPTVERVSTMLFLHMAVSYQWTKHWYIGDISNAFLQGSSLEGKEPMYMKPPKQGLKGVKENQLLKLLKPVYGRPDAPRAWYEELARVLTSELGFVKSCIDPAVFMLRDDQNRMIGCMVVHVDDLMVCHDGSVQAQGVIEALRKRFPFGTWERVAEKESVTYCGKEIRLVEEGGEQCISLSQDGFIDGRLDEMEIASARRSCPDAFVSEEEKANYRSIVGSLQWLATQSRPDVSFETNQLQKRISDLRVFDLLRANKAVRDVKANRLQLKFRNLGRDAQLIVYTDAGLYSSVGVEIDEKECEDILMSPKDKRLVYSQKGAVVGFVERGSTDVKGCANHINVIDWRSSTNKRVIESSFAGETHAALMALGMGHFCQVLMSEMKFGSQVIGSVEDDGWNDLVPMTVVTDCKSIYDTVHKDGQHISDKASVIHAVLLRQMLSTRGAPCKAKLLWVPTRHQIADGLTKGGRSKEIREQLGCGVVFKEEAAKRRCSDQKEIVSSVKVVQMV